MARAFSLGVKIARLIALAVLLAVSPGLPAESAPPSGLRYAGIEFYGSSQLTRHELERSLGIRPGASLMQVDRAVERLNKMLGMKHINSQVQIVQAPPSQIFVVVDVLDSAVDVSAPTRRLKDPRHVLVRSEKPFLLMDQLEQRLEKLSNEGRPWSEQLREGIKYYSDEPANLIVEQILKQVPDMREELVAVTVSDPDPNRRRRSIELLHWAGNIPDTFIMLIPAIDDADSGVRAAVARYMFPRFEMLPDDFPFQDLVEAYSRMLARPSHQDRTKALHCLLALSGQRPELTRGIKIFNEERIKKLCEASVIPTVKAPAEQLQTRFMALPPEHRERPAQEFGQGGGGEEGEPAMPMHGAAPEESGGF